MTTRNVANTRGARSTVRKPAVAAPVQPATTVPSRSPATAASASAPAAGATSPTGTAKRHGKKRAAGDSLEVGSGGGSSRKARDGKLKASDGENVEKPEKRMRMFRKKCPKGLLERISRAVQQRMYLVERCKKSDVEEEFAVLGSTGNVYTVTVSYVPQCTCPDFLKGTLCKHIFFVYLKVLRLSRDSPLIYQSGLLTSELYAMFAEAIPDPLAVANQRVRDHYKALNDGAEPDDVSNRKAVEGDCPICFEPITEAEKLAWCRTCGNNLHDQCFGKWKQSKQSSRSEVTCVYCRAHWRDFSVSSATGTVNVEEGYMNLRTVAGLPEERDTSTYSDWYHGGGSFFDSL